MEKIRVQKEKPHLIDVGELYYLEVSELIRLSLDIGGAGEEPTGVRTYELYLELIV